MPNTDAPISDARAKALANVPTLDCDVADADGRGGYLGGMSRRAAAAYAQGRMPKSKWTKTLMLEALSEAAAPDVLAALAKLTKAELFEHFFQRTEWHHTGAFAGRVNRTDFHGPDLDAVRGLTVADVEAIRAAREPRKSEPAVPSESLDGRWVAAWDEWPPGRGRHRRPREVRDTGTVKGAFFQPDHAKTRKRLSGAHFELLWREGEGPAPTPDQLPRSEHERNTVCDPYSPLMFYACRPDLVRPVRTRSGKWALQFVGPLGENVLVGGKGVKRYHGCVPKDAYEPLGTDKLLAALAERPEPWASMGRGE